MSFLCLLLFFNLSESRNLWDVKRNERHGADLALVPHLPTVQQKLNKKEPNLSSSDSMQPISSSLISPSPPNLSITKLKSRVTSNIPKPNTSLKANTETDLNLSTTQSFLSLPNEQNENESQMKMTEDEKHALKEFQNLIELKSKSQLKTFPSKDMIYTDPDNAPIWVVPKKLLAPAAPKTKPPPVPLMFDPPLPSRDTYEALEYDILPYNFPIPQDLPPGPYGLMGAPLPPVPQRFTPLSALFPPDQMPEEHPDFFPNANE